MFRETIVLLLGKPEREEKVTCPHCGEKWGIHSKDCPLNQTPFRDPRRTVFKTPPSPNEWYY